MPICKRCGVPIDFIRTPAGKYMPVQPRGVYAKADDAGKRLALDIEGRVLRVAEAEKDDPEAIIVRFPHWEFCPGAEEMRHQQPTVPPLAPQPQPQPQERAEQLDFMEAICGKKRTSRIYGRL